MTKMESDDAEVMQQDGEQEVETTEETTQVESEESTETDETDWKAEADKWKAEGAKWKAIAARNKAKEVKSVEKTEPQPDRLADKDVIALAKADVHEDDIQEVLDYAKFKKVSVSEALKSSYVNTALKEASEKRKSAEVANTGATRRSSVKSTPEQVLANARRGITPKTDEEWEALHEARRTGRK